MRHDRLADGLRGDLALTQAFQLAHDLGDGLLDPLRLDIALAQRDLHRAHHLSRSNGTRRPFALDHDQLAKLHPLESGETEIAR